MNSTHRLIIFNRAGLTPVDGWIHIVPKGELPNREAGIVQVLDDAALDSILANIERDKNRLGEKWPGIYAGREHFIYDSAQDSAALGWFKRFVKRADGIWAGADGLTRLGTDAVTNRLYKFTSFVADPADLEAVGDGAPVSDPARFKTINAPGQETGAPQLPRYRVKRIETVGFTNYANGKELLTPITNRLADLCSVEPAARPVQPQAERYNPNPFPGASAPADSKHQTSGGKEHSSRRALQNKGPHMHSICALLGLSADSDEPSVHAAVAKLLNRGDIAPDALAALRAEHQSLGEQIQLLLSEQAEALLDGCGVKEERVRNRLKDGMKLLKNRHERLSYLADFGYKPGATEGNKGNEGKNSRVLNRGTGAARETAAMSATISSNGEQALAIKILNRASELQGKGLKYDPAWNQARREVLGKN